MQPSLSYGLSFSVRFLLCLRYKPVNWFFTELLYPAILSNQRSIADAADNKSERHTHTHQKPVSRNC